MTSEEVELLRELTIVIPTCEKPENLERAIEYWRDTPITVHIVDGSEKPWFPIGSLQSIPTITYHHLPLKPGEEILDNYSRRLRFATSLPVTKYSALCADDDAFTLSGLVESILLLNANSMAGAAAGHELGFAKTSGDIRWWLRSAELVNNGLHGMDPSVKLRTKSSFRNYYGICKTPMWAKKLEICFENNFSGGINEDLMNIVGTILLPTFSIKQVLWLRSKTVRRPQVFLSDVIWAENFQKSELDLFVGQVLKAVKLVEPEFAGSPEIFIEGLLRENPNLNRSKNQNYGVTSIAIRKFVLLPIRVQKLIRRAIPQRIHSRLGGQKNLNKLSNAVKPKTSLNEMLNLLELAEIMCNKNELKEFEKLLLKPREELRLKANI